MGDSSHLGDRASSCSVPKDGADARTTRPAAGARDRVAAVDVAIATIAPL